ncbi:serine hydrolase domain-containing protein [Paracoccus aerodenitrificans]|uniref:serine hydrolase domain-containing protein n=1 Tax=Paracoccus aerodenitrificans TaxID=3017781 RepID=UPI0022F0AA61|nr:serine hydrolase domain-containing protein [Paracoccus aerodenitrificans]WBU64314.1 serine hydrolase [Paracoccus aerodenitrificans]
MTEFDSSHVRNWISREQRAGRLRAGALMVCHGHQKPFRLCFGSRSQNVPRDEVSEDTAFWIASMTKPVVTVAAMRLIEDGKMTLHDAVTNYVPGFGSLGVMECDAGLVPLQRPVTVLDLMTHSSGLTYGAFGDEPIHREYRRLCAYDFQSDNATMASRLAQLPLLHQPGEVFEYGMSTDLLGRVIEVVAGETLDIVLRRLVLDPLGMHRTGFLPDPSTTATLPDSAVSDAFAPPVSTGPCWCSAGAGLFSTLADYNRFAAMLLGGGRLEGKQLLRPETVALMSRNNLPENVGYGDYTDTLGIIAPTPENGLGFGLSVAVRTKCVQAIPGAVGEILWPGISGANFWVDPVHELTVVLLTHAPEERAQHRIDLRRAVYAGLEAGQP